MAGTQRPWPARGCSSTARSPVVASAERTWHGPPTIRQVGRFLGCPPRAPPPPSLLSWAGTSVCRPQHPPPWPCCPGPGRQRAPGLCVCAPRGCLQFHGVPDGWLRARPALGARATEMSQTARPSPSEELPAEEWGVGETNHFCALSLQSFSLTLWALKYPQPQFYFLRILLSFLKYWCIHFYHQKNAIELFPC